MRVSLRPNNLHRSRASLPVSLISRPPQRQGWLPVLFPGTETGPGAVACPAVDVQQIGGTGPEPRPSSSCTGTQPLSPGSSFSRPRCKPSRPPPHVRTGLAAVGRASANPGESRMEMMVQLLACLSPTSQKLVRLPWKEKPLQLSCNKVF